MVERGQPSCGQDLDSVGRQFVENRSHPIALYIELTHVTFPISVCDP